MIEDVQTSYCKPKLEQCQCKALLEGLLLTEVAINDINRITGYVGMLTNVPFIPDKHYIKGCRCLLGAAARQGFQFFKFSTGSSFCIGAKTFTVDNYVQRCENLLIKKCYGVAEITRTDPDVY